MLTTLTLSKSLPYAFEFNLLIGFWSALKFIFQLYRNKFSGHSWNFWWPFGVIFVLGIWQCAVLSILALVHQSTKHLFDFSLRLLCFSGSGPKGHCVENPSQRYVLHSQKTPMQPFQWPSSLPFWSNLWINKWTKWSFSNYMAKALCEAFSVWTYSKSCAQTRRGNRGVYRQVIVMLLGVWHWIFAAVSQPKG